MRFAPAAAALSLCLAMTASISSAGDVAAADPRAALRAHLPARPKGRVVVIGAGKGAAQLAAAFEDLWDGPLTGVVVTRYGYGCPTQRIRVLEAAHPVPDQAGLAASEALFAAVAGLTAQDAEKLIAARYEEKYLQNPQVSLFIKEFTTQRITIEGAVAKPGIYPVTGQLTLLRALARQLVDHMVEKPNARV